MLSLDKSDIQLHQSADNKDAAIRDLADGLHRKGFVEVGYVEGMLARERQNSTYLGSGIAIPHGTTATRGLVKSTGVVVHHFPQGVDWGNGNTIYLAIGIAAKSDEHLGILKQLTKVLSADGMEEKIKQCTTADSIASLLNGDAQSEATFNADLVLSQFPATDVLQLTAAAAGLLKNQGLVDNRFVADVIGTGLTYLGQGLWLARSDKSVSQTAFSFVTSQDELTEEGLPLKGILMLACCNDAHIASLVHLVQLMYKNQLDKLFSADKERVVSLLTQESLDGASAVFTITNPHGLHARPGAMLVSVAKKFNAAIQVVNLNGESKPANAKSLMKVIALGVKCRHQLQFTAQGEDAELALESIGQAIADGLGEG
ncbi:fused PTS fructose transporter subunit IIA/HPr protein [Vibrio sp. Of7-15]|uniref:fused PTS fructose transporter subunit IIA/HPr protein n=1 Tax=Vibrio sp. Of7-15 TaxID=2724879 RepID=UPI001EF24A51|nr:fused PTS fructose transporter subunit IIA/HPr protein [Vibrio sp. Of7-15]MCG7498022.1 fused PTS fructose transporter subunit IIA/HPr protein [Vibrio sp. Of7-15]